MADSFTKDPDAELDYAVDWTDWLGVDEILTSSWTVPAGLTNVLETNTTTAATVWLSGGTVGEIYTATNHIVTAAGREDDRTITLVVVEK